MASKKPSASSPAKSAASKTPRREPPKPRSLVAPGSAGEVRVPDSIKKPRAGVRFSDVEFKDSKSRPDRDVDPPNYANWKSAVAKEVDRQLGDPEGDVETVETAADVMEKVDEARLRGWFDEGVVAGVAADRLLDDLGY